MGKHMPHYSVDLGLPPEERWQPLLTSRWVRKDSCKLAQDAFDMFFNSPPTRQFGKLLKQVTHAAFKIIGTGELDYMRDVQVWGEVIGDKSMASMANLSYERQANPICYGTKISQLFLLATRSTRGSRFFQVKIEDLLSKVE